MSEMQNGSFEDVTEEDIQEEQKEQQPDSEVKQEAKAPRTFTADEVNELVEKRLAREKRAAEEEKRKASMNATQRAQAEKAEAERLAAERMETANTRVIRSEAKLVALDAGVRPDRAKAVLELARGELSSVEVDDFGDPDGEAIAAAIQAVVKEYPEFTAEGSKPAWGKAPEATRGSRSQANSDDPEAIQANFLQNLLGGR